MRVIPVLDVKAGRAVRAVAGMRANYEPVTSILHEGSDPVALARAYRELLGLNEIYVADLDAISGSSRNDQLINGLVATNQPPSTRAEPAPRIWLDAGVRDFADVANFLMDAGIFVVVLGSESLRGPDALRRIVTQSPLERVALSLDLRNGVPITDPNSNWGTDDPVDLAERGLALGITRLILLDLARVGTASGIGTIGLLSTIRARHPDVEIIVGGGVARREDLSIIAAAGASAVLIGSALHDGRLRREDCLASSERNV
jgi:phosphoribosylformimino-5-aminoimidazole carboxamide ribotide isomerase